MIKKNSFLKEINTKIWVEGKDIEHTNKSVDEIITYLDKQIDLY